MVHKIKSNQNQNDDNSKNPNVQEGNSSSRFNIIKNDSVSSLTYLIKIISCVFIVFCIMANTFGTVNASQSQIKIEGNNLKIFSNPGKACPNIAFQFSTSNQCSKKEELKLSIKGDKPKKLGDFNLGLFTHPGVMMLKTKIVSKTLQELRTYEVVFKNNLDIFEVAEDEKLLLNVNKVAVKYCQIKEDNYLPDINSYAPSDRAYYEKAIIWLDKVYINQDLSSFPPPKLERLIRRINKKLTPSDLVKEKLPGTYRDLSIIIAKNANTPSFTYFKEVINFLKDNDPKYVKTYEGIIRKLNEGNAIDKIMSGLSDSEKSFIVKYYSFINNHNEIPSLMKNFTVELSEKFKNKDKSFEIAAWAHMRIIEIHSFFDGNGRTARLFMNWILSKRGIDPLKLSKNKKYTEIVREAIEKKDPAIFAEYLKNESKNPERDSLENECKKKLIECEANIKGNCDITLNP